MASGQLFRSRLVSTAIRMAVHCVIAPTLCACYRSSRKSQSLDSVAKRVLHVLRGRMAQVLTGAFFAGELLFWTLGVRKGAKAKGRGVQSLIARPADNGAGRLVSNESGGDLCLSLFNAGFRRNDRRCFISSRARPAGKLRNRPLRALGRSMGRWPESLRG